MASRHSLTKQAIRSGPVFLLVGGSLGAHRAALLDRARATLARVTLPEAVVRLDVTLRGNPGQPLTAIFAADGNEVEVSGATPLTPALSHGWTTRACANNWAGWGTRHSR